MIPADATVWGFWVPLVLGYFLIGFGVWLVAGLTAQEYKNKSFWRVTFATLATFWFVWPLALLLTFVWVVGFGAVSMTIDAWRLRGKS